MLRTVFLALTAWGCSWSRAVATPPLPAVPEGFEVEVAAEAPIVERPVMACFDERGRLYVVDSAGVNEPFEKLLKNPPHRIVVIEDTDGDGKFDRRTVFADRLVMPQGVLPYRGAVYTASPPSVWKLEDTDGDGVCDRRTEIVTEFGSNGNAADIHGPFLGPDGWLYLCDGRHGHKVQLADGSIDQGLAGGIFRFRTDGGGFQRVCGGGFDNPVEIEFTDEGEMLGTVNILHGNPRQDCLMHWIEGGVYPRADQEQCIAEFKRTGDLLPPIKEFGHVAVSGVVRYRSEGFGSEYCDNLFITFFNRHKVVRSILERSGSTFTSREEEFLSSDEKDFHPTDVLEDADGSLLVVDTGGWFRLGCPVSEIAKPDVLGVIYRVRKKGMKKVDDPRGLALGLDGRSPKELVESLDDPRPSVRERAIELLARRLPDSDSGDFLSVFARKAGASRPLQRRNALWVAGRMLVDAQAAVSDRSARSPGHLASKSAPEGIRQTKEHQSRMDRSVDLFRRACEAGLDDRDLSVQRVAARVAARNPAGGSSARLRQLVAADDSGLRQTAAMALGKSEARRRSADGLGIRFEDDLGREDSSATTERAASIAALLESLHKGPVDRFLEHAVIYALIEIHDRGRTQPYLQDRNPDVRRAALTALDQMSNGELTREQVTPLLDTDDPALRKAALAVIASRKGWLTELVESLRGWLASPNPGEDELSLLRGVLLAQTDDQAIRRLIGETLAAAGTTQTVRLLLWEVVLRAPLDEFPEEWLPVLEQTLASGSPAEIRQVVTIVDARNLSRFDARLAAIADDSRASRDLRIEVLAALAPRLQTLTRSQFSLLLAHITPESPPLLTLAAARGLSGAPLSHGQLAEQTHSLAQASPLALPILVRAYARCDDITVGREFVAALERAPASANLSAEELTVILQKYPGSVHREAGPLLARLGGSKREEQKSRLEELAVLLRAGGNVPHGRDMFFGKKGACSSCHTIAGEGGRVGPDLTKIGASRSGTDLLEAIVFPSATFAREFRPYVIATDSGKVYTGIIARQTSETVHLRTADLAEIRIPRASIEEMRESNTSIMPKGLDATLTAEEFRDLLAYLQQLK